MSNRDKGNKCSLVSLVRTISYCFVFLISLIGCMGPRQIVITHPENVQESMVQLPLSVQVQLQDLEFAGNQLSAIHFDKKSLKQSLVTYLRQRKTFREVIEGSAEIKLSINTKYTLDPSGPFKYDVIVDGLLTAPDNTSLGRYVGTGSADGGYSRFTPEADIGPMNEAMHLAWDDLLKRIEDEHQIILARLRGSFQPGVASKSPSPAVPVIPASDVDHLPAATGKPKKNAYAVVIGIEQYREKLPKADFADRDAKVVGEYLTKVLGYPEENVVVRLNERATRTDLVKYFEEWLKNNVEPGGSVFVYYSGHGAPNTKTGEAYLVPYDGDPSFVDSTAYPVKQMYAALDKLPAKDVTVVLDSCFSGAGGRSVLAKGARPMVLSDENPVLASGKTIVLAASGGDQISNSFQEQGHGLLTYYFLKGLQGEGDTNKDGVIELAELYDYVKPNVQRIARKQYNNEQTPQLLASPEMLKKGVLPHLILDR